VKFATAKLLTFYSFSRRAQRHDLLGSRKLRGASKSRFATCVLQSGVEMPISRSKPKIADSLNVVVQIERRPRRGFPSEVSEIRGHDLFTNQGHLHQVAVAFKNYS
jgi:hypothetical protein